MSGSEISCRIQISRFRSCRVVRLKTHQKKTEKNAFFAICDHFFHTNFFPNDLKLDIVLNPNEDYLHYKFCANRSTFSTPKVVKSASKIVCTSFAEPLHPLKFDQEGATFLCSSIKHPRISTGSFMTIGADLLCQKLTKNSKF